MVVIEAQNGEPALRAASHAVGQAPIGPRRPLISMRGESLRTETDEEPSAASQMAGPAAATAMERRSAGRCEPLASRKGVAATRRAASAWKRRPLRRAPATTVSSTISAATCTITWPRRSRMFSPPSRQGRQRRCPGRLRPPICHGPQDRNSDARTPWRERRSLSQLSLSKNSNELGLELAGHDRR